MTTFYKNECHDCDWEQSADNVNKYLRKCPNCGAPFRYKHVQRIFYRE